MRVLKRTASPPGPNNGERPSGILLSPGNQAGAGQEDDTSRPQQAAAHPEN